MEDHEIANATPSNWQPMRNPANIGALSKLCEELGECISAAARCMAQGMDEAEPKTGKINRQWLEDEIADVRALIITVEHRFKLDKERIADRAMSKMLYKKQWLDALDKEQG